MKAVIDKRLIDIAEGLKNDFSEVSLRGSGAARFVFVQANHRAAEASIDNDSIWVEYWDSLGDDERVASVKEATLKTAEEARAEIANWLTASCEP